MKKIFSCYFVCIHFLVMVIVFGNVSFLYAEEYRVETTAGKLKSKMKGKELNVTKLFITGTINGTDFKFIREKLPNLTELDLSDARIVPGGKAYLELKEPQKVKYAINESDILPYSIFKGYSQLEKVVLPKKLKKIEDYVLGNGFLILQFTGDFVPEINLTSQKNTVIVPNNLYPQYKKRFSNIESLKLQRDTLPKELFVVLDNTSSLKDYIEGGEQWYNDVRKIVVQGNMKTDELKYFQYLPNLECIDLSKMTIKDPQFQGWLQQFVVSNSDVVMDSIIDWYVNSNSDNPYYSRLNSIISIDDNAIEICEEIERQIDKIDSLKHDRSYLLAKIKEVEAQGEKLAKEAFNRELIAALVGLSDDVLKEKYKREEVTTEYYMSNRIWNEVMKNAIEEERKKGSVNTPEDFDRILNELQQGVGIIDKKIKSHNNKIQKLKVELKPARDSIIEQLRNLCNLLVDGSIIPSDTFLYFRKLQTVILPDNTVVLEDAFNRLSSDKLKVKINRNNILVNSSGKVIETN